MNKYDEYLTHVEIEAGKLNKHFFLDSGEGNDYLDSKTGWYIEELSGWLISEEKVKEFLEVRQQNKAHTIFGDNYVLVKWKLDENGALIINFKSI